jgi:uncharacterized protein (TIGR04255 family)
VTLIESSYPQLSRPPLREAIIDVRLRDELPMAFVDRLRALSVPGFEKVGELKVGGFKFEVASGRPSQASVVTDEVQGIRLQSADAARTLQYRRNGMTLSVLKNYKAWEPFRDAAHELWQRFLGISGGGAVGRLAVRYINAIEVPIGANFDDYLTAAPRVPEPLPQLYTSFLQRIVIPFAEAEAYAIITEALEQPTESTVPTVLDIDVASNCAIDSLAPEIWDRLSRLRLIKNRIFFASLTARALEVYR